MLKKVIYNIGALYRNPNLNRFYEDLKASENYSIDQLEELQRKRCKSILIFANKYSKFWKNYFKDNNFDPYLFNSLDDLKKLPPINKKHLIDYNDDIHTDFKFKKSFFSETSGSSGEPLKFWKNEEWDSFNRASIMRGYSWYDVKPWHPNGYFWGYNFQLVEMMKTKLLDYFQNRFRLFKYDEKNVKKFIAKLRRAKYIHGYSSMIYEVSKKINTNKLNRDDFANVKLVKGTSEKIFDKYQEEVKKAFGKKMISEYGAAESGIIAFECPYGNMHENMEGVIVEVEDKEIIVTNLNSLSFPIIRYKLGDYIELSDESDQCPCGMKHRIIKDVVGRVGKMIFGMNNNYPSLTLYYVFKNLSLNSNLNLNYTAIQNQKGKLLLKLEQELDIKSQKQLDKELNKYFIGDLDIEILDGQDLQTGVSKKKDFISNII